MDPARRSWLRLGILGLFLVGLIALAAATGLRQRMSLAQVRAMTEHAGVWGAALFTAVFCFGELIQIPGMLFVAAAILVYGRIWGGALAWVAGVVAMSVSFVVVRAVGGRALTLVQRPIMKRLLAGLEARPVRSVFVLRILFQLSPAVSYVLALSPIRYLDYLVGSALGLVLPVLAVALFLERLVGYVSAHF